MTGTTMIQEIPINQAPQSKLLLVDDSFYCVVHPPGLPTWFVTTLH